MGFITNMAGLGQLKLIILGILAGILVAAGIGLAWKFNQLEKQVTMLQETKVALESSNKILQANIDVLKDNMQMLSEANLANQNTANALIKERASGQQAINTLAASTVADKQTISKLYSKLDDILKDPANDGLVSPALRETIRNIQNSRK